MIGNGQSISSLVGISEFDQTVPRPGLIGNGEDLDLDWVDWQVQSFENTFDFVFGVVIERKVVEMQEATWQNQMVFQNVVRIAKAMIFAEGEIVGTRKTVLQQGRIGSELENFKILNGTI